MSTDREVFEPLDETLHAIDALIDEISGLSKSGISEEQFFSQVLERAVSATAALEGFYWRLSAAAELQMQCATSRSERASTPASDEQPLRKQLLQTVLSSGKARLVPPVSQTETDGALTTGGNSCLIVCPLIIDGQGAGVLEVVHRASLDPATQRGNLRVWSAVADLAGDFLRNCQFRQLRTDGRLWGEVNQFSERVHQSLDLSITTLTIANDGRRLIGCDRLSVGQVRGQRVRLLAVSGVDSFDRKASTVRRLQRLAEGVVRHGEPIWWTAQRDDLPPEIAESLQLYLDISHARALGIVPLADPRGAEGASECELPEPVIVGVIVVETFDLPSVDELIRRVQVVLPHCTSALTNAVEYRSLPLLSVMRALRNARWFTRLRQLPMTVLVLLTVAALVAAGFMVQADFDVDARGELQPQQRQHMFAPSDGQVIQLQVDHDMPIKKGQLLVKLRSAELDLQIRQVEGEIQTVQERLFAIESARLVNRPAGAAQAESSGRLSATEEELRQLLTNHRQQLDIVRQQREQLSVLSPVDGRVLTWDTKERLAARPVQRGQVLMTVADVDGPWQLELHVSDERVGHVLSARETLGPDLSVSFILATDPEKTFSGILNRVATVTRMDDPDDPSVLVTVDVDREKIPHRRPGARVIAKIHCGRRSIGLVWFHDVIHAVRSRLLF